MEENYTGRQGPGSDSEATGVLSVDNISEVLSGLLPLLPDAALLLDQTGNIIFSNPQAADLFRLPPSELNGCHFPSMSNPENAGDHLPGTYFRKLAAEGACRDFVEIRFRLNGSFTADCTGKRIKSVNSNEEAYLLLMRPLRGEAKQLLHMKESGLDLAELRKTRDALRESEHMYKVLIDNSMDIVCQLDLKGYYTYVSPSVESMLGYTPIQLLGRNSLDFIHPDDLKNVVRMTMFGVHRAEKQIRLTEFRFRDSGGSWRWFQSLGKPLLNKAGKPYAILMSSRDISRRKKRDEDLLKFVSLVENSSEFIGMCDLDGLLIYLNRSGSGMLGARSPDHITGKTLDELFAPHAADALKTVALQAVRKKGSWRGESTLLHQEKGTEIAVQMALFMVRDTQTGKPVSIAVTLQDIRERRKYINELKTARLRAEQADKAKSEFLANISHEIRTPLNSIIGFADLLGGGLRKPKNRHYLDNIRASGKNLLQLINDILDLSKIESGHIELQNDVVDLHGLIREIESVFVLQLMQKNIAFRAEIDHNLPKKLILDEVRVRQILLNLVGNAVKFTHKGFVRVKVQGRKRKGGYESGITAFNLSIMVEDTGIGIDPSQQRVIFESFRQQSGQSNRKYGGTGLGLTITQKLVRKMGGTVRIKSEPGLGSQFSVRLPGVVPVSDLEATGTILPTGGPGLSIGASGNSGTTDRSATSGSGDPATDGIDPVFSCEADSSALLSYLEDIHKNDWPKLRNTLIMSQIRSFGEKIAAAGIRHQNHHISRYAALLLDQVETIDVERIPGTINDFEKILTQLKQNAPD